MRIMILMLVLSLCLNPLLIHANAQYDVKTFGAKGDGITLDTRSIQNAIDKAHDNGGGVVEVPVGTYKIGTLIFNTSFILRE